MNYWRVATASPSLKVGDVAYNKEQIVAMAGEAAERKVRIMAFPEMALTGYTAADLLGQGLLLDEVDVALQEMARELPPEMLTVVGAPVPIGNGLYDAAVCFYGGGICNVTVKAYPAGSKDSYEKRWFSPAADLEEPVCQIGDTIASVNTIMEIFDRDKDTSVRVGVEIGSDLWAPIPPSSYQAQCGAELILCPAAAGEVVGRRQYRKDLILQQSARTITAYAYAGAGIGESTTDGVFPGDCYIAENGVMLTESPIFHQDGVAIVTDVDIEYLRRERLSDPGFNAGLAAEYYETIPVVTDFFDDLWEERDNQSPAELRAKAKKAAMEEPLLRNVDPHPFLPPAEERKERSEEITEIQAMALARRMQHIHSEIAVIGISGGLDSTLALLVTCRAMDIMGLPRTNVHAITMPGLGTSDTTKNLAGDLMEALGVTAKTVSIAEAARLHLKDIGHEEGVFDSAYENAQARERTQVLMDYANMVNGIVVGTGDLSEIALGWCTYNGDHMSMYGVNAGVPKTLVRYLVGGFGEIHGGKVQEVLEQVLGIPISPELLPPDAATGQIAQKTEDLVGPYELHDFFLYHMIRYGEAPDKIYKLAKMAFEGVYDDATLKKWLVNFYRRFFISQFKRNCSPDGPKVGAVDLSPRGSWRMPSDAAMTLWMEAAEAL